LEFLSPFDEKHEFSDQSSSPKVPTDEAYRCGRIDVVDVDPRAAIFVDERERWGWVTSLLRGIEGASDALTSVVFPAPRSPAAARV